MDDKPIKSQRFETYVLSVFLDQNPMNPREMGDPLFTMVAWDERKIFTNSHARDIVEEVDSFDSMEAWESSVKDVRLVQFPYTYTDFGSGGVRITVGANGPGDEYDGTFYVTIEKAREEKFDPLSAKGRSKLKSFLLSEIGELESWCNGWVYGYVINEICLHCDQEITNKPPVESCWGYFGDEELAWKAGLAVMDSLTSSNSRAPIQTS